MPLPEDNSMQWPPKALENVLPSMAIWDAWYRGDADGLSRAYSRYTGPLGRPSTYRGGIVGHVARWFWGAPPSVGNEPKIRMHIPVAADLCQVSSDLLFADPPLITSEDQKTADQLNLYQEDDFTGTLTYSAEVSAALGGAYLRASWDSKLKDHCFLTTVDADGAWPKFSWGTLTEVIFWWELPNDKVGDQKRYRHLEYHYTDNNGIGMIEHALYLGTTDKLGRRVPLNEREETAPLLTGDGIQDRGKGVILSTETKGIAVEYAPNLLPQRTWRHEPVGRYLGRADLDGVEGAMDSIDRTYSSWMRDIDLGKGRIIVPEYMLEVGKAGDGVRFDLDREVYSVLNAAPDTGVSPTVSQFAIRVVEHQATIRQLVRDVLRSCGYSAQTFGEEETGTVVTATEVVSRDRRSMRTRDRKIRLWKPAIVRILSKMLDMDRVFFNAKVNPEKVEVSFSESSQDTPQQLATTASTLAAAGAASTKTLVAMVHPDWDSTQVDEEVALIKADSRMSDSSAFGVSGFGL